MSAASIYEGQTTLIPVVNAFGNVFEEWQIAVAAQTVFTIASFQYTPGTNTLLVFKNGIFQQSGVSYTETDSTKITFVSGLALNDRVAFFAFATAGVAIPNGGGLPAGGTTGQLLAKINGSDYNAQWVSISAIATLLDSPIQTVVSATTINLTGTIATQTRNLNISGTTPVTGFQIANGQLWAVRATGAFSLVNSASLNTQTGSNINVGAGDTFFLRATADNVVEVLVYTRATSPQLVGTGYCRLVKSGTPLVLIRWGGNTIPINGAAVVIPVGGVSLTTATLTVNTTYYIYAFLSAGVLTLEASTTGHSQDATTGIEIKTGDPTRSLVGQGRVIAGSLWVDSASQRFVSSWYNRKPIGLRAAFGADVSTLSNALIELNPAFRNEFLAWASDPVVASVTGSNRNNNATSNTFTGISVDGVGSTTFSKITQGTANAFNNCSLTGTVSTGVSTDGYHYITLQGAVSSGTGTWDADVVTSSVILG